MNPSEQQKIKISASAKDLTSANERLREALAAERTRLNIDATIQRFEFTIELAWKLMQSVAHHSGRPVFSPRDSVRVSAQIGLIGDPDAWMRFLETRNLTTHVYKEEMADMAYEQIKKFPPLVDQLLAAISARQLLLEDPGAEK